MNTFYNLPFVWKNAIIIISLILFFVFGFTVKYATNVKKSEYIALQNIYQDLKDENAKISDEYNSYKSKMQPYEAQQEADVKASEEKAAAEAAAQAQAQKEAEKKAAAKKSRTGSRS